MLQPSLTLSISKLGGKRPNKKMSSSTLFVSTGLLGYETLHTRPDVELKARPKELLLHLFYLSLAVGPCSPFSMS